MEILFTMKKTDYKTLRSRQKFSWFIGTSSNTIWTLAGVSADEFYKNPNACIEAYRKGRPKINEIFGDDIPTAPILTPMIKYGHVNTIGAKLNFPQGGEVHHSPPFDNPEEGIKHLQKISNMDFATAGLTPFYIDFLKKVQAAFPDEKAHFGWQWEGPVTTAWELLGANFMYDLFDKPDVLLQLLNLSTASIVEYCRFFCKIDDTKVLDTEPDHGRLCDDIAAMIPPRMWPDFVLPYWNMFYGGPVPARILHCEDMKPDHLQYLEQIPVTDYDPGISPKLNPHIINAGTRVPFGWRLGSFHYDSMNCQDVADFVYCAAADGASYIFTWIEANMCDPETVKKVRTFINTAKETKQLFDSGKPHEEIAKKISPAGRQKFWSNWLDN